MRFLFDKTELRKLVSKEMKLLLCCARTQMSPERIEGASHLIEQGIDWNELYRLAAWHKLIPMLYHNLSKIPSSNIPESFLEQLKTQFAINLQGQFTLLMELIHLAKLFNDNRIPFIPFKGVVLAQQIYGTIALRNSGDLDILIQPMHIEACIDFLNQANKYAIDRDMFPLGLNLKESGKPAIILQNVDTHVCIDLQWHLGLEIGFNFPVRELFPRTVLGLIGSTSIQYLSKEDHLLALCAHGAKHLWCSMLWICDVAEFLQKYPELNWEKIQTMAKKYHIERIVYSGVFIAHILLDAPLIFQLSEGGCKANWLYQISAHIIRLMLIRPYYSYSNMLNDFLLNCYPLIMNTSNDRIKYIVKHLAARIKLNDQDRKFIDVPRVFNMAYLLIKPLRLTLKSLKLHYKAR